MKINRFNGRRAISPVLATVILIAITLVAGVAIAGFAFGLFGTLGTTANISVTSASCKPSNVYVTLTNTGGAAGTLTGATPSGQFTIQSVKIGATNSTTSFSIPANTAVANVRLVGTVTSGQTITGSLVVNGGVSVPFTATCT